MRLAVHAGHLRRLSALAAAAALALLLAAGAAADPIGPDCDTCQGSVDTLRFDPTPVATTASTQTFRITFTIDSSAYTGGGVGIDTVAVKVTGAGGGLVTGQLVAAPGGVAEWNNFVDQGLNASGCSSGGSGFDCARVKMGGTVPALGGTLVWTWDLEVPTGSLLTDPGEASVKARYVDVARTKVGALVSEEITLQPSGTPVPEPTSLALEGLGLLLLAAHARRTRAR